VNPDAIPKAMFIGDVKAKLLADEELQEQRHEDDVEQLVRDCEVPTVDHRTRQSQLEAENENLRNALRVQARKPVELKDTMLLSLKEAKGEQPVPTPKEKGKYKTSKYGSLPASEIVKLADEQKVQAELDQIEKGFLAYTKEHEAKELAELQAAEKAAKQREREEKAAREAAEKQRTLEETRLRREAQEQERLAAAQRKEEAAVQRRAEAVRRKAADAAAKADALQRKRAETQLRKEEAAQQKAKEKEARQQAKAAAKAADEPPPNEHGESEVGAEGAGAKRPREGNPAPTQRKTKQKPDLMQQWMAAVVGAETDDADV
jgi:hypothetical protein